MKSKTIRIPESRFLTRDLDPEICHDTTNSQKSAVSPHGAVETFRLPWRSTAEARHGAAAPRRLRRGRAAAAPRTGRLRAPGGPRAPRDAHRGEQLGVGAAPPGEVQQGAADVLRRAVTVAGGWCCILCWEKLGKIAGKQQPHFQIISEFVIYVEVR